MNRSTMNGSTRRIDAKASVLSPPAKGSHALVIGSGMAGLLAARILAEHFEQVTIVERDHFPQEPTFRAGVPQSRHLHVLLRRGQMILEQLFPGLEAELAAAGAPLLDWGQDPYWLTARGLMPRFPSGVTTYACSRHLLEWIVRRRLVASASIRFAEGCDVIGLFADTSNTSVAGVGIRYRDSGAVEACHAQLVVDASGRTSQTPEWLEALGYARPEETIISAFMGYASRFYQRPPGCVAHWKNMLVQSRPPESTRGGTLFPVEGDRWIVTVSGAARDYPPTDEVGFLAFVESLPSSILYDAIKDAQPLSAIHGYRQTENRLRHYEHLPQWPEGFVVLGDAVCALNPVYGQGMTTAAVGALTLQGCLRHQRRQCPDGMLIGMSRRFQQALARVNTVPWHMATLEDFRFLEYQGGRPSPAAQRLQRYLNGVRALAFVDPQAHLQLLNVMHMLKPPRTLAGVLSTERVNLKMRGV